jgi:hypothetical protein
MAIAGLYNVPSDRQEWDDWGFVHMAHHRDINAAIFRKFGIRIDEYALDPIDPNNPGQWEDQHQAMHEAVDAILGAGGFDLTDIQWTNPVALSSFIQSNATEHRQWADKLGVD